MNLAKSHGCLGCQQPFTADARNVHHQKYCTEAACRQASKAASRRRWLAKPENQNYHSGPVAVARVRAWQHENPAYRERQQAKRSAALQDVCEALPEPHATEEESAVLLISADIVAKPVSIALQEVIINQPTVFIGLIAHFFNLTLQDDIANTTRSLQQLGEDITNGRHPGEFLKTAHLPRTPATGARAVQLGGSSTGAG